MNRQEYYRCRGILLEKGCHIGHYDDEKDTFYGIIGRHMKPTSTDAAQCRVKIASFITEHSFQFLPFLPSNIGIESTSSKHRDILKQLNRDISLQKKGDSPPHPREVYAAAECLEREIVLFRYEDETRRLHCVVFAPIFRAKLGKDSGGNEQILALLMPRNKDKKLSCFVEIKGDDTAIKSCLPSTSELHKYCNIRRFRNSFDEVFMPRNIGTATEYDDLYSILSRMFYGTERYRDRILEMVCKYAEEPDHIDMVACFIVQQDVDKKKKIQAVKHHISLIRKEDDKTERNLLEFLAIASVFNVPVFVGREGVDGSWKLYTPITGTYGKMFENPLIIAQGKGKYKILHSADGCLCKERKPCIKGKLGPFRDQIYEAILERIGMRTDNENKLKV